MIMRHLNMFLVLLVGMASGFSMKDCIAHISEEPGIVLTIKNV